MTLYYFSPSTLGFYPEEMKSLYIAANTWPDDLVGVSDDVFLTYSGMPPEGQTRGADENGQPVWVDLPPLSHDEEVEAANAEKQKKINQANDYMNSKQWPGKAAIGRLNGDELAQYNLWLDYLDALEQVNTSSAPDIEWPTPPVTQAS
ncbi:tail fiber assembly protein [Escherichia coli]|uniref:Tail fiber assembly protein n=4 Tax=root TaxID=1 RepID=A0A9E7ICT8_9CAUD|nr:tail fiber assembly protein [Escherichia coli]URE76604.1 tail fiber assembly protein [Escherichia phage vB_EcoM-613R3]AVU59591.1 tail fiber assembly protein [Escherichia coli]EFE2753455.1 tail fiber assembly protein [Escherichia coli]EFI3146717.1 tail fiber assembly protein [Escherichia coli]EHJ8109599.1 tail fiber assembly protein [Escherichia coli]